MSSVDYPDLHGHFCLEKQIKKTILFHCIGLCIQLWIIYKIKYIFLIWVKQLSEQDINIQQNNWFFNRKKGCETLY